MMMLNNAFCYVNFTKLLKPNKKTQKILRKRRRVWWDYEVAYNKHNFLIDTGVEVSVTPANPKQKLNQYNESTLVTANGTRVNSYGSRTLNINSRKS